MPKYGADPAKYDSGEQGDQASERAQVEPELDIQAILARLRESGPQQARRERRERNREAHAARQAEVNELARIAREERRKANRAAFAKVRKR